MKIDELGLTENDYINIDVNSGRFMLIDDLPNEVWRDVVGFENYYQVSNYGRVKSLTRKVKASIKYNNRITRKSCILKQYKKHDKYWGVALCKDGKHYNKQVHILVGKVFLQNDDCKKCIDHIKPVSTKYCNNYLYNLRYATHFLLPQTHLTEPNR